MNLLVPYIEIPGYEDPLFSEYTYGDQDARARKMRAHLYAGDYVFFHTLLRGAKQITAYYVVDRVIDVATAARDAAIRAKYKNPHLLSYLERKPKRYTRPDVILFADPIRSRILPRPLPFTRILAKKLRLNIDFPKTRTEAQAVASATRAWRELSPKQVEILLREISRLDAQVQKTAPVRSSEEVTEVLERDIEAYLASAPSVLEKGLELYERQGALGRGRLDLVYTNRSGDFVIVEIKLGQIGHAAVAQIRQYIKDYAAYTNKRVRGVIVCAGVLPAYQAEIARLRDIKIFTYGWRMQVTKWAGEARRL